MAVAIYSSLTYSSTSVYVNVRSIVPMKLKNQRIIHEMNPSLHQNSTNYDIELATHDSHYHLDIHFLLACLEVYQGDSHIQHPVEGHFLGVLEAYFY